jgi:hypothetical protein
LIIANDCLRRRVYWNQRKIIFLEQRNADLEEDLRFLYRRFVSLEEERVGVRNARFMPYMRAYGGRMERVQQGRFGGAPRVMVQIRESVDGVHARGYAAPNVDSGVESSDHRSGD